MPQKKVNKTKRKSNKGARAVLPKRRTLAKQTTVKVGNISDISGELNIAGKSIIVTKTNTGLNAVEIKQLFDALYTTIESRVQTSPAAKEDLKAEVQEVQTAVTEAAQKNEQVDENFIARHFRNIARMAPDILDIVVKTLANPMLGIGEVVKKIAEKAKADTGS